MVCAELKDSEARSGGARGETEVAQFRQNHRLLVPFYAVLAGDTSMITA